MVLPIFAAVAAGSDTQSATAISPHGGHRPLPNRSLHGGGGWEMPVTMLELFLVEFQISDSLSGLAAAP